MNIRIANHQDLPTLLEFEQQIIEVERPMDPTLIQDQKISYYPLKTYIDDELTQLLVAESEAQLIGGLYGQIRPRKDYFKTKQYGHIGFVYVKNAHRGQGVSQALIAAINQWFEQQGITEIRLQVYAQNPRAIKAYEKVGFKAHLIEMRLDSPN